MSVFATSDDYEYEDQIFEEPVLEELIEEISGSEETDFNDNEDDPEEIEEETISDNYVSTPDGNTDQSVVISLSEDTIIKEIVSLRDENVKAYSMADHSIKVCYYPEPVNYMDDEGRWETIDNRFHYSRENGENDYNGYKNNSAPFDLKFAACADEDKLFSIGDGEDKVSFVYVPSQRMVNKNEPADENTDSEFNKNSPVVFDDGLTEEIYPDHRDDADGLTVSSDHIGWKRNLKLVSDVDAKDDSAAGGAANDRAVNSKDNSILYNAANNLSGSHAADSSINSDLQLFNSVSAIYEDVETDASFRYTPFGNGVKESIIIDSKDAPDTYSFLIDPGK
ncbi:MAG: hypothetical protein IKR56_02410, partial [Lachnospiraceae bacterium]|nr:hypothetical protein [Lachnospiraceae bacterium]